jgi:putative flippase GtrA
VEKTQFLRFILVGLFNTGLSYSVYAILLFVGLHYTLANLLALTTGIIVSFKLQGRFVFNNTENNLFFRFVALWGMLWLLNITLIKSFLLLGFNDYVAGAFALPFMVIISYILQKNFVFEHVKK